MIDVKDLLTTRAQAYKRTFPDGASGPANIVLKDLAKFCRANETTYHEDPRAHALLEGRREVWLRITQHLNLTEDELFNLLR